jgi:ubiquinol-cytochrome c reductase cytochrome c1 subunit
MIRWIARVIGIAFVAAVLWAFGTNLKTNIESPAAPTAEHEFHLEPKEVQFASDGPFGKFNKQQLQRGFQVYKEVCSGCHSLSRVAFRDLHQLGYNEAEVKAIANQWQTEVPSVNLETGEPATRKATPADYFPSPYANETAARAANNNALPPDLSLMAKAREGGPTYIYSLLTGYADPNTYRNEKDEALPATAKPVGGLHFNPYFANLNIAMPPPLTSEGQVTYAPGNPKPTVDQMAKDVSAFLMWTAEPNLQGRHKSGWPVLLFLIVATILAYLSYQNIWAEAKRKVAPVGPLDPVNKAKRTRASKKAGIDE